jgi:hypothetical protein
MFLCLMAILSSALVHDLPMLLSCSLMAPLVIFMQQLSTLPTTSHWGYPTIGSDSAKDVGYNLYIPLHCDQFMHCFN